MPLDGAEGDEQLAGALSLREAAGEQSQHLELALGQLPGTLGLLVERATFRPALSGVPSRCLKSGYRRSRLRASPNCRLSDVRRPAKG
jgi:hypothetical protein